jgi:lysophospholipase L1-like esterase
MSKNERDQVPAVAGRALPVGRKLLFSVITVIAALGLLEAGARLWLRVSSPAAIEIDSAADTVETDWLGRLERDLEVGRRLYVPDEELFWRLRPGFTAEVDNAVYVTRSGGLRWTIQTNEDGYRGPRYPADGNPASPVVLSLGDSCTFGFRVSEDETYPAQLQAWLREHGQSEAVVLNYGIPGYTTFQGRRLLERILADHRPDVVVLAFGANDHESDRFSDAEKAERLSATRQRLARLIDRLAVVRVVRGRGDRRRDPSADPEGSATARVSETEFRDNLQAMVLAARQAGVRVLLLDLVFIGPVFRQAIADTAGEQQVPWVDGRKVLTDGLAALRTGSRFRAERAAIDAFWDEEMLEYNAVYFDEQLYRTLFAEPTWSGLLRYLLIEPVHPNPLGNRIIAEAVGREIIDGAGEPEGGP